MFYKIVQAILGIIFRPLFLFEIRGMENIPADGGFIICANHKSNWDPVFLGITFRDQIHFMAKKELFTNPILDKLARGLGAFPVDREGRDLKTIRETVKRLDRGEIVGILPEGTRTKNIDRANMKEGVAYLALKADTLIVPVEIISKFRPFSKTKILIKEPLKMDDYKGMKNREAIGAITADLFDQIYEVHLKESIGHGY